MAQPTDPIIVSVVEEPVAQTTVVDVVVGSLGLTAALIIIALLLGAALGGLLIGFARLRTRYGMDPVPDSEALRVTPHAPDPNSVS